MTSPLKHTLLAVAVAAALPMTATAAEYYYNVAGHADSPVHSGVKLFWNSLYWGPANDAGSGAGNNVYLGAAEYKVGCAAGGYAFTGATAPVAGNSLTISGGKFISSVANYGGYGEGVTVERNKVRIEGDSSLKPTIIYGGYAVGGDAVSNTVEVETNGDVSTTFGGVVAWTESITRSFDVRGNTVKLIKGKVDSSSTSSNPVNVLIVGGQNNAGGNVVENSVEVSSPDAAQALVIGGMSSDYVPALNAVPTFSGNKVIVHKGAVVGTAHGASAGGIASVRAALTGNVVEISGKVLENAAAAVACAYASEVEAGTTTFKNNRIVLKSGAAVTGDVAAVRIEMPEDLAGRQTFVSEGNTLVVEKGADISKSTLYGVQFVPVNTGANRAASAGTGVTVAGATLVLDKWQGAVANIAGFDSMDVRVADDVDVSKPIMTVTGKAELPAAGLKNVTLTMSESAVEAYKEGGKSLKLLDKAEGGTLSGQIVGESTTQKVQNESGLVYADAVLGEDGSIEVGEFRTSTKAHGYFEGVSAMLSMSAQSADLAAGSSLKHQLDAMDAGEVRAVGVMEGSSYRWQTGSSINVRAMSALAGAATKFGDVDAAAYVEFGHSDFDTVSVFDSKGDGEYYGVGALARWHAAGGFYTEGSVRMGWLDASFDGEAATGGYDQSGLYAGFHLGAGHVFTLTEASKLDVYAQYFYTHQKFDDVTVAGSDMQVDDADSSRTRLGARYTYGAASWKGWAGLAWDHEFDGETGGSASGVAVSDAPALEGDAAVAECGLSWQDAASPWSVDVRLGGYASDRDGVFGSLGASYRF